MRSDSPPPAPSPTTTPATPMPWREIPGESAHDRTTRWLHHKPEVRDHMAFNLWLAGRGKRNTEAERTAWAAMTEAEREVIRCDADRQREEYAAMPDDERAEHNRASLDRTLAINDAALPAPSAPPAPAPACASTGPHGEPCQVEGAHVTHESSYGGHVMRWDDSTSRLASAPASEWDEMDRLAHDAMSRNRAIASPAEELLARACTPERVAQLVAVARETEALRRMLETSTVRLGILRDRMEACAAMGDDRHRHELSLEEIPAWIEEQQAAARASRPTEETGDAR